MARRRAQCTTCRFQFSAGRVGIKLRAFSKDGHSSRDPKGSLPDVQWRSVRPGIYLNTK